MPKVTIRLNPVFLREDTKLQECSICRDVIFSDVYRLWIMPKSEKLNHWGNKTSFCACESCKDLIKM